MGNPIIFKQRRCGLKGKEFYIYKFRSLTNKKNIDGSLLPDVDRTTIFGKWLRSNSFDELPQLINILIGDMSFVGPRPFVAEYKKLYTSKQFKRHDVKPGFTGLAQVKGRNNLTWEQKFAFDLYYVKNLSLKLDFWILIRTVGVVLTKKGILYKGNITSDFKGK